MDQETKQRREDISAEAALWVVRLAEPNVAPELLSQFEAWRSQSPDHDVAFERERYAWERADALKTGAPPLLQRGLFRSLARSEPAISPARRLLFRRLAASVAAIGLVGAVGAGAWMANFGTAYATAVGERRLVILDDGSKVEMNTDTKLVVRYTPGRRTVALERGEALFEVAPNAERPFVVLAGDKRVLAVGTAFNVRKRDEGIEVLVSSGVVSVAPDALIAKGPDRRLAAGMSGRFSAEGEAAHSASQAEIERTLAWRYGAIVLNGETLDQAVAEFNRYNLRQLEVADPSISKLKLGGYFQSGDLDNFVHALKSSFGIAVVEGGDQRLYLSRAR